MCNIIFLFINLKNENNQYVYNYSQLRVFTSGIEGLVLENKHKLLDPEVTDEIEAVTQEKGIRLIISDTAGFVYFNNENQSTKIGLKESLFFDSYYEMIHDSIRLSDVVVLDGTVKYFLIYIIPSKIAETLFQSNNYTAIAFYLLSAVIILSLVLLWVWYNKIYHKPITELRTMALTIARGNWDCTLPESGATDVSLCIQSFDLMRKELKKSIEIRSEYEQSRKELVTYISHDLKTPLAIIRGYVESIMDGVVEEDQIGLYHRGIQQKVIEMGKLIEDLFVHSQMELNELSINRKPHYLDVLLEEILALTQPYIELEHRTLEQQRPYAKVLLNVDKERIEQVLMNLINNAVKYSDAGSTISVSAEADSEAATIIVRDDGKGISREELPFIFEKFYRGDKARNSANSGAGIGLAVCKYAIEAHGGTIRAESRSGLGTKFTIMLPIA